MSHVPILSQTKNILRLYAHQCGRSEIPLDYHLWACISLIAAAVGNNVWFSKYRHTKLAPNMYILLVGTSGSGKDMAINVALSFLKKFAASTKLYAGRATAPYIIDYLSKSSTGKPPNGSSRMFLVTPELAMSIGSGSLADEFVKLTTALYTGGDYPITEGTRTSGTHTILNPCFNFLGGTTEEWMMRSLTRDHIEGGFFARIAAIRGAYDDKDRMVDPVYPPDYEDVIDHLHYRIKMLTAVKGEFEITPGAKRLEEQWYMARELPQDDSLLPSWRRQSAMILKLAMLLSLADNVTYTPDSFVIDEDHFKRAYTLSQRLAAQLPYFLKLATQSEEIKWIDVVWKLLQRAGGPLPRYKLLQFCSGRGLDRAKVDMAIDQLILERKVLRGTSVNGGIVYACQKRKIVRSGE